jgi:hypothetical protein
MGVFSMYAELAAAEGQFEGYVRPDPRGIRNVNDTSDKRRRGRSGKRGRASVNVAAKILEKHARKSKSRRRYRCKRRDRRSDGRRPDDARQFAAQRVRRRSSQPLRRLDQLARTSRATWRVSATVEPPKRTEVDREQSRRERREERPPQPARTRVPNKKTGSKEEAVPLDRAGLRGRIF